MPKMNIVQILLFLSVYSEWELQQFDLKNVFLHGNLDEEVYMDIPLGFGTSNEANVCRSKKVLYGLKQLIHKGNVVLGL